MHQASILFTFMVLVMGAVWVAMTELGGAESCGDEPPAVGAPRSTESVIPDADTQSSDLLTRRSRWNPRGFAAWNPALRAGNHRIVRDSAALERRNFRPTKKSRGGPDAESENAIACGLRGDGGVAAPAGVGPNCACEGRWRRACAAGKIEVKVLSSKFNMISGGDALVEVKASEGARRATRGFRSTAATSSRR